MSEVSIKWLELKRFVATDKTNHTTVISGTEEDGKIGIKPVDLLLMSLGSCMGLSIVYVLQQKRQKLEDFEVHVTGKMKEDVRKVLLLNAKRFIEFSDLENLNFKDMILTGSMANFNYNESSDLDLHIILDFDQISENEEFVSDYLMMKKSLWNERMPIQIKGHDVEMYYQDAKEPHHSTGTYSVMKDEWINEPTKQIVDINSSNIQLKSADLMNSIDDLADMNDRDVFLEKYTKLKDKIKKMRQSGLETEGEFSSENLAFKVLRNTGYLGKLIDLKNNFLTQELSMNENR